MMRCWKWRVLTLSLAGLLGACGDGELTATASSASRSKALDFSGATDDLPTQLNKLEQPQYTLHQARARLIPAVLQVYYNPTGAPSNWDVASMLSLLQRTANKWSDVCNVRVEVIGTTGVKPVMQKQSGVDVDGLSVVGWMTFPTDLASFSGNVSWWYRTNADRLPAIVDADMGLNLAHASRFAGDKAVLNLGGLLTHEWGHMLGINHSDVSQSVMFAAPYNSYTFQNSLRGDDAAACADLYGAAPYAQAMRVFNWAEQVLPDILQPLGVSSTLVEGFPTREYSQTGFALQVRAERIYYRPGFQQAWIDLGLVSDWFPIASSQGF